MQKQMHRSPLQIIADLAVAFRFTSARSGAMMGGDYFPTPHGLNFHGPHTMKGRIKHAGETRRIKKFQRRRAHLRSLRG